MSVPQPPPLQTPKSGRQILTPMVLSALVYPGAGQLMQRRWLAATVFVVGFSLPFAWFLGRVYGVLKAYYEFAFNFKGASGQAPQPSCLVWPLALSIGVYLAGLVDTAIGSYRARVKTHRC